MNDANVSTSKTQPFAVNHKCGFKKINSNIQSLNLPTKVTSLGAPKCECFNAHCHCLKTRYIKQMPLDFINILPLKITLKLLTGKMASP